MFYLSLGVVVSATCMPVCPAHVLHVIVWSTRSSCSNDDGDDDDVLAVCYRLRWFAVQSAGDDTCQLSGTERRDDFVDQSSSSSESV